MRLANSEKIIVRKVVQRRLQPDDHERLIVLRIQVAKKRSEIAEYRVTQVDCRRIPVVADGRQQTCFSEVFAGCVFRLRDSVGVKCKDVAGFQGELVFDTTKPDGTPRKLMDVTKLHNLGWKHTIELDAGIKMAYADFVEHYDNKVIS